MTEKHRAGHVPVFLKTEGAKALVVGGGSVALRKIQWLLEHGLTVHVVARELHSKLQTLKDPSSVLYLGEEYGAPELQDYLLVICATSNRALNRRVAQDASKAGTPVNVVDAPDLCTFNVPSTLRRGEFSVAVGTGGNSPTFAARARRELEPLFPDWLSDYIWALGRARLEISGWELEESARRKVNSFLAGSEVMKAIDGLSRERILARLLEIGRHALQDSGVPKAGKVSLVGAGPGDPGLLTLKGLRRIFEADVVIHDGLVNLALLGFAKESAEVIDGSKREGRCRLGQEEINSLMVERALAGMDVCRLKGGDPFVFGRGGEEALHLARNGIRFEIVSGVTSPVAALAYAGIPLTHRDMASHFQVITGHERPGKTACNVDWAGAARSMGTLVFLMGSSRLEEIARLLISHGKPGDSKVVVISNGTRKNQAVIVATLEEAADGKIDGIDGFPRPSLFAVGDVVGLRSELDWFTSPEIP